MVRTPPFQGENPGSNPSGAAKIKRPPFGGRFILCQSPDENRRFDTIVGKNKRNALRAVRALRVVSNVNNPSGAAKIDKTAFLRFFVYFPILSQVRKLGVENYTSFTHLRTFFNPVL